MDDASEDWFEKKRHFVEISVKQARKCHHPAKECISLISIHRLIGVMLNEIPLVEPLSRD